MALDKLRHCIVRGIIGADVVVLAKIADIRTAADNAGWAGREITRALSEHLPSFSVSSTRVVTVEVLHSVVGPAAGEKISFEAFVAKPLPRALGGPQGGDVVAHGEYLVAVNPARARVGYGPLEWSHCSLAAGQVSLFCLRAPYREEGGNRVIDRPRLCSLPVGNVSREELVSAGGYLKKVAEWDNPPKLSPQEEVECAAMIKTLGDESHVNRAAAAKALIAKGPCVRRQLEEALADPDPEIGANACGVFKAIRPPCLRDEPAAPRPGQSRRGRSPSGPSQ